MTGEVSGRGASWEKVFSDGRLGEGGGVGKGAGRQITASEVRTEQ